MIETHPFESFVPANATCLILGTFPTHRKNWRFNAYYPGRSNFFWRLLSEIYQHPFVHKTGNEAARERIQLCADMGIALSDTIYKCRRKVAESSKDTDLQVIEIMDVLAVLKTHKNINRVILTGSSGVVSAHSLFFAHLAERGVPFNVPKGKPPLHGRFKLDGRTITTHTLYSTSGINIGRYAQALQQYQEWLP